MRFATKLRKRESSADYLCRGADVQRAIRAGARGYLLKSSLHEELLGTIRAVYAGKKAISAEASFELAEHATDDALTPAEVRVLRLIAQGNANKEIAEQLSVSEETVKGQVRNILSKLGAKDLPSRHDGSETRHHRGVIRSKSLVRAVWGLCLDSGLHNLIMSCVDFSQLLPTVRLAWVFSCSEWLQASPWCFTLRWHSAAVPLLYQPS